MKELSSTAKGSMTHCKSAASDPEAGIKHSQLNPFLQRMLLVNKRSCKDSPSLQHNPSYAASILAPDFHSSFSFSHTWSCFPSAQAGLVLGSAPNVTPLHLHVSLLWDASRLVPPSPSAKPWGCTRPQSVLCTCHSCLLECHDPVQVFVQSFPSDSGLKSQDRGTEDTSAGLRAMTAGVSSMWLRGCFNAGQNTKREKQQLP